MTRKTDHRDAAKSQSGENYQTFLRAARDGDLNYVIKLLNSGIKINVSNQIGLNALHLAAKENHIEIVNELIRRSCDVEAVTKKGNTPLHIASLAGNYEIVKILLDNGANVNKQSLIGFTPLYMAAQENHLEIVNMLLSRGADQALTTNDGFTPLAVALQQGHEKVVTILLEKDNTSRYSLPALHIAARKDDVNSVNLLLSNPNANVNHQSMTGFTPLHIAAHYGNVNVASCLIAKKADVNFQARNNITPLHVAAKWGKTKMASLLLKNQALIDCKTRDGLTPLHCAARSGFSDICELLMDSGAHPSATTRNGLTPLHMAAQGNNDEVARILILRGAGLEDITGDYLSPLHVAAHCGNEKVAAILLQTGCDVNPRALNGFTPLHIACKKGREGMVDLLIKHNSQISSTTELGLSPLHVSAFIGNAKIVQKLLNAGASVDQTTMRSETPLHLAVRNCQMEAAEALIAKGAKIDAPAKDNETPLHIAVFAGHLDLVTLLLKNGANPNFPTKDAFTALHFAAKSGNIDIIRTLLDSGANMLARHKKGFTCLHFAAKHGRLKAAKMLLNHCQKTFSKSEYSNFVNAKARNDLTAIHIATHYNKLEMVQLLIDHDSDLYCRVSNGYSLLHIAAKYNHSDIATLILAQDLDQKKELPNSQSNCGFTPLHLATQAGYCDMVSLLLQHSANVDHQSKNGLSALHLAAQEDRVPVAQVLVAAKCKLSPTTLAGYTPLHTAAHFGQVNMVRFLLNQSGVGVNEKMSSGFSPLHLASQQGHSKVVQLLIDTGADPNIKNQNGLTAAHLAQQKHYVSIFDQLKKLTTSVKSWDMTNIKEQYQLEKPEVMGEIVGSESEDETAIYMNDVQDQMQIQRQMVDESFSNGIVPFEVSPSQNDSSIPSKGKLLKPPSEMDESDLVEVNIDYWKQMTYTDDDQINMKNILTISPGAILHHTNDESFNSNEISLGKERMIEYTNLPPSPVFNRSNKDTLSKNTSMRDEFTMDGSFHENSFKTMSSVTSPVQNMSSGDYDKFSPINRNGENEWAFETTNMEVIRKPIESCFLASFLVDARGCLLQAQRYPLLKIFIPPNAVTGPTRILMRLNRIPVAIPQLNDGDGLGCRIIEMSPVGLKFNSPVLFEIPYNADIEANDREMIVLRSENGSSWKEQGVDPSNHAIQQSLGSHFENVLPKEELKQNRVHRILTHDIPQYFALITRIKQDLVLIGPEGGFIHSTVVPTVRSEFPPGALQKRIRVGLQAQTIKPELVSKIAGNRVSVSPIVTIEPRRRKFHKPIVLTIPLPKTIAEMVQQTGKSTNLNEISSLRLLCSISGGTAPAFWEDITGSTMLNLVKNCAQFTTTVSARLWLFDCPNIPEVAELATKIYREASAVPYIGRMAIYGKRMDAEEAQLRCIMLTDDNIDKTLECQEGFHLLCTSPETQVLQNHTYWLETSGNLIPISKAAKQLSIGVRAFEENRLNLSVRMKNPYEAPCGKFAFVHSPKWSVSENESKGGHDDKPITILDLTLPQVGIAPKLPYSASNTPKLDHQAGFNKLSSMNNNNESPADLAKSDLNLKSLADNIKNDWERVARSLGVDNAPIAKKHQGNDYEAAYATLLEWQRMNPTSTGNQLKTALEKSGHGEIIKSSMSNVKLIKNEREINSALKELQPEIIRELVSNGKEATADDQLVPHIVSRHKEVKIEKVDPAVRQKNRMEIENILAQDFKNTLDLGPPVKDETVPKVEEEIIRAVVKEKSPIVIPKDAEDIIMPKQSQVVKSTEPAIYLKEDIERGNTKPSSDIGKVEESIKPKSSSAHHASVIDPSNDTVVPSHHPQCGEHESTWGKPQDCSFDGLDMMPKTEESTKSPKKSLNEKKKKK